MSERCELHVDALVDRATGRLDRARARSLEAHLAVCDDCRETLHVIGRIAAVPTRVPADLESRIRTAVRDGFAPIARGARGAASDRLPRRRRSRWPIRAGWALPLTAAAALAALWIGTHRERGPAVPPADVAGVETYEPYGAWPAVDGQVAGEPLLSDLTVEELERLLEEMES